MSDAEKKAIEWIAERRAHITEFLTKEGIPVESVRGLFGDGDMRVCYKEGYEAGRADALQFILNKIWEFERQQLDNEFAFAYRLGLSGAKYFLEDLIRTEAPGVKLPQIPDPPKEKE